MIEAFFCGLDPTSARLPQVVGNPSLGTEAMLSYLLVTIHFETVTCERLGCYLEKHGYAMQWPSDAATCPLLIQLGGPFIQYVFGRGGNDSFQVVVVSIDLSQVLLNNLSACDCFAVQVFLKIGCGSCKRVERHVCRCRQCRLLRSERIRIEKQRWNARSNALEGRQSHWESNKSESTNLLWIGERRLNWQR